MNSIIENKINKINNLTIFEKLSIYMNYFITQKALELTSKKDFNKYTFEEFISDNKIKEKDNGIDWKNNGFAQRVRVDLFGIFDYAFRFDLL